jgi:hypothetical protein
MALGALATVFNLALLVAFGATVVEVLRSIAEWIGIE